jgi:Ca2+-binding EF-hand superfamily protein
VVPLLQASAEGVKYSALQGDAGIGGDDLDQGDPHDTARAPSSQPRADRLMSHVLGTFPGLTGGHAAERAGGQHGGGGGGGGKNANKFSASVKQAWKTKKAVKRRRSVTALIGGGNAEGRTTIRRVSVLGGMGFNFAHLAALRAAQQSASKAVGATQGPGSESDSDGSGPSSSSASEDSSNSDSASGSGSEVFDINAKKARRQASKQQGEESSGSTVRADVAGGGTAGEAGSFGVLTTESAAAPAAGPSGTTAIATTSSAAAVTAGFYQVQPEVAVALMSSPGPGRRLLPRTLPPVGVNPWKATGPPSKRSSISHVFSRMQKSLDSAMSPRPVGDVLDAPAFSSEGRQHQHYDSLDAEDSKQAWGEVAAARNKQLPPLQGAASSRSVLPPLSAKASARTIFEYTLSRMEGSGKVVPTAAAEVPVATPSADSASTADSSLSPVPAEAALRANASPPRTNSRKTAAPAVAVVGAAAAGAFSDLVAPPADQAPATGSPAALYAPRGAKIQLNPRTVPAAPQDGSPAQRQRSLRFSDLGAADSDNSGSSRDAGPQQPSQHKQSLVPPPIGSLRFSPAVVATAGPPAEGADPAASSGGVTAGASPPPLVKRTSVGSIYSVTSQHAAGGAEEEEEAPIAAVFFLHWPELYLEGVQSVIMIIALYWALYFTNFVNAAHGSLWKLLAFLPAILSALLLVYIVKSAVMLGAIHAVDCDAILDVLEQTEGAEKLSALIKEKVTAILSEMGPDPQAELVNLFAQIDSDGSGSISKDEFAEYMNSIEIHFDRRRWMQVFRGIDTTFDNKVRGHLPGLFTLTRTDITVTCVRRSPSKSSIYSCSPTTRWDR